jgi:hypothetical protein
VVWLARVCSTFRPTFTTVELLFSATLTGRRKPRCRPNCCRLHHTHSLKRITPPNRAVFRSRCKLFGRLLPSLPSLSFPPTSSSGPIRKQQVIQKTPACALLRCRAAAPVTMRIGSRGSPHTARTTPVISICSVLMSRPALVYIICLRHVPSLPIVLYLRVPGAGGGHDMSCDRLLLLGTSPHQKCPIFYIQSSVYACVCGASASLINACRSSLGSVGG